MNIRDAVFYHIYPFGALGVLNGSREPNPSPLHRIERWIPRMRAVGANVLWLGPLFESEHHGYDTVDFFRVDRRLGSNEDLANLARTLREQGISLVLDAVYNHVGRTHPIVQEVIQQGAGSPHAHWISGYDPSQPGPDGMPFRYNTWDGHHRLVKLDTGNAEVQNYLIEATLFWMETFGITGLRLDAANVIDHGFMRTLAQRCRERNPEFFLIGESVHGDSYAPLIRDVQLDSVTNYEVYKGLWSSYNDRNYHEIAWSLNRLFGEHGVCPGMPLYSFADNHDVDRVASSLRDRAGLFPLYGLMFAMPGVPSIYYGSEFGIEGKRQGHSDLALRPELDPDGLPNHSPHPELVDAIARFAAARKASRAVREGNYRQLGVEMEGIAFLRQAGDELAIIAVNGSPKPMSFSLNVPEASGRTLTDILDPSTKIVPNGSGKITVEVPPHWLCWFFSE